MPYNLAIPLLVIYLTKLSAFIHQKTYGNTRRSFIVITPNRVRTNWTSKVERQRILVYSHSGILLSNEKGRAPSNEMNESFRHWSEWKASDRKSLHYMVSLYEVLEQVNVINSDWYQISKFWWEKSGGQGNICCLDPTRWLAWWLHTQKFIELWQWGFLFFYLCEL